MTSSPFDPDALIADAVDAAEADDLGDPNGIEGLRVYCESVAAEAKLNELGEIAIRGNILGNLINRLRIVEWEKHHATELASESVDAPLVVVGMFRAGTTFLSYLLDQDPGNRSLLRWEASDPVPPPTPETFRSGPRVDAVRASSEMMEAINPGFKAIHHEDADGPTECISIMAQDFKALLWESITNVPSYSRWLLAVDQTSAYAYHHRVLKVLQSGGVRGRWALKSPHHAIAMEPLVAEYPDATLVVLHRDPLVLCASVCSLITTLSGTFTDADHSAYITSHWPEMLAESIDRIDRFRAAHPAATVVDVQYADLVRDPVGTMERLSDASGRTLGEHARSAVQHYVDTHPKGRFGTHSYDLAGLGLDAAALEDRFAPYIARYDVVRETVG